MVILYLGPLTAIFNGKVTLVGINSFVAGACSLDYPDGFARVTFRRDWILSNSDAGSWQCTGVIGKLFRTYVLF